MPCNIDIVIPCIEVQILQLPIFYVKPKTIDKMSLYSCMNFLQRQVLGIRKYFTAIFVIICAIPVPIIQLYVHSPKLSLATLLLFAFKSRYLKANAASDSACMFVSWIRRL